jgi:hypothetical protein
MNNSEMIELIDNTISVLEENKQIMAEVLETIEQLNKDIEKILEGIE